MRKPLIFGCLFLASLTQNIVADEIEELLANSTTPYSFILLGASGDLSKRSIYPSLWNLYRDRRLPPATKVLGYAPTAMTIEDIRKNVAPFVDIQPEEAELYDKFWQMNYYIIGTKDNDADYNKINRQVEQWEENGEGNRIFYMAIPPSVFPSAASQIKRACMAKKGITRVVIEKPFGSDSESSKKLSDHLKALFTEDQIFRTDHFLGIEMSENLLALRFANQILEPTWNQKYIAAIKIDFQENFGVEGRGGYFDKYGIIRDVVQNHLLQILSLVTMDKPKSNSADDIRNAKVELLKKTDPVVLKNVVVGQYIGNPESKDPRERIGYLEDPTVPKDSRTATFSLTVLKINNARWFGVPFIIRAGKGLAVNDTQIIVQYKNVTNDIFNGQSERNELIFKISNEALEMRIMSKIPGISFDIEKIKLRFDYKKEYCHLQTTGPYSKLILSIFSGSQELFVRTDELSEAWRIFTPMLHRIDNKKIQPVPYKFGSNGPTEADILEKRFNFL